MNKKTFNDGTTKIRNTTSYTNQSVSGVRIQIHGISWFTTTTRASKSVVVSPPLHSGAHELLELRRERVRRTYNPHSRSKESTNEQMNEGVENYSSLFTVLWIFLFRWLYRFRVGRERYTEDWEMRKKIFIERKKQRPLHMTREC